MSVLKKFIFKKRGGLEGHFSQKGVRFQEIEFRGLFISEGRGGFRTLFVTEHHDISSFLTECHNI